MQHLNKKIKLDNNNNDNSHNEDNIFLNKIWRNIIIKLKILSFLSTIEENGYQFIYKYDEIYSVEFMLLNNHYGLLRDKVKRKQYLTLNYGLEYNGCNKLVSGGSDKHDNGSNLDIPNYKKTIFNCINNDNKEDTEFYQHLFKNYEELFLSSFENTCRILVNYNCLVGFKVLQQEFNNKLLKRNGNNNSTCIPPVELFINSISNGSLSISNYFYKSFKNKLKYSEKELWSRVLVDNELTVINKIQFIINTLPISNNLQITQLKFNVPFYKNQLSKLLDCCLIISTLKSNLKNYINALENEFKDYKLFNEYNNHTSSSISNNILTVQEIQSMVQSLTENEKETMVYKLDNDAIERLLNMVLPFTKFDNGTNGEKKSCFEKSLNYQIFKFMDVLNSKELFKYYSNIGNDKKYLYQQQLKYGIFGNILKSRQEVHYNFKKILKYQTNLEKRKQFLLEFYSNNSDLSIIVYSISGICLMDGVDLNLIQFIYSHLQNKEVLPLLENWQSIEIFDYFMKEFKDKFNINLTFLLKNNAKELILNHYRNNYNQDYQNYLNQLCIAIEDKSASIFYLLHDCQRITFILKHYNDFSFVINKQQFWDSFVNYSHGVSIDQFKQFIIDYQGTYKLSSMFRKHSKEMDQAISWVKLKKPHHLLSGGNCLDSELILINYNFHRYKTNISNIPPPEEIHAHSDVGKRVCTLNFSIMSSQSFQLPYYMKCAAKYGNIEYFKYLSDNHLELTHFLKISLELNNDLKECLEITITQGHLQLIIYLSSILKGTTPINFNNILIQSIENENNLLSLNHLLLKNIKK